MSEKTTKIPLSKTALWVTLAHLLLLLLIGFWPSRKNSPPPEMTMIEMIEATSATPSSKGPAPTPKIATGPLLGNPDQPLPAPSPASPPAAPVAPAPPPAAVPEKKSPPPVEISPEPPVKESTPESVPAPTEQTDDFAVKEPKKKSPQEPKKESKKTSPPDKKSSVSKKTSIKVNLKEVARAGEESEESTSKAPPSPARSSSKNSSSTSTQASPSEITSRLGAALGKSGSGGAIQIGPLSSPGGGSGNFGSYYDLIRKQMFSAWNRPVHLTQKELSALVKITIENDGRISNVALVSGSGIRDFDESIVEAARRVGRIREPLPEGLNHEITIRFKLDD